MECFKRYRCAQHLIVLMRKPCSRQEATIRTEYGETECFSIGKGIHQDCTPSPYLFNLYAEHILRKAKLDEDERRIKTGCIKIKNLRYVDDTSLLVGKPEDLKRLVKKLKEESVRADLQLNLEKTKIMTTGTINKFTAGNEEIEIFQKFTFLGSIINQKGDCT